MSIRDELQRHEVGRSDESLELGSSEDSRLAVLALAGQARRSIDIVTRDLDPRVYDDADTVACIKDFALASRRSTVRILVRDVALLVSRGHRLVDLQRRLPSHIGIRTPGKAHQDYNSAFVLVDQTAMLFRNYADRYEGMVNFNDPQMAEELGNVFSEMWENATVPADLRSLVI